MMKVLYIVHSCVPYGANVALINLIDKIRQKGVDPMVIYAIDGEFRVWLDQRKVNNKKIFFYFHAYPHVSSLKSLIAFIPRLIKMMVVNFLAKRELEKIVGEFQPEIIHTNIGPVKIGFDVARKRNIPHVWHIREYQKLDFGIHFFPSMKSFRRLIMQSHVITITKSLFRFFNLNIQNSRVIYDGVMDENETRLVSPKEKYFLFVGRLEEAKGTLPLIEAFAEFAEQNDEYRLLVAGTGDEKYMEKVTELIDKSNLGSRVELLGFRSDRFDLMAKASALIVPSKNEGFGLITAEAMFNGCLVIGNNTGGTKEIIDNSCGNAIAYLGKEALVNAMNEVVSKGISSYFITIENAQKVAAKRYNKEKHANEVYKWYTKILEDSASKKNGK